MKHPIITILGSCRQDSLYKKYNITSIKNNLSYPHYTKEVLQVIKYCLFDNLAPEQTMIFRTPILNNLPIKNNPFLNKIEESNVIFIEVSSKSISIYRISLLDLLSNLALEISLIDKSSILKIGSSKFSKKLESIFFEKSL